MPQTITITQTDDGKIHVDGPLQNKQYCYGLLEVARDLIKDYKPSPIVNMNGQNLPTEIKSK